MTPILSILIPSIPERLSTAIGLYRRIQEVVKAYPVEIIMLTDNRIRTIGAKREQLKNMATGDYLCFVDDDDKISDNYHFICHAIGQGADVITFKQHCIVDHWECWVDFDLAHTENQTFEPGATIERLPWHVCAWKRELVQDISFPLEGRESMYGEDWAWCEQALKRVKTQTKIDESLHTYIFNSSSTAAK